MEINMKCKEPIPHKLLSSIYDGKGKCAECSLNKKKGGTCNGRKPCVRYTTKPRPSALQLAIDDAARDYYYYQREYNGMERAVRKAKARMEEAKEQLEKLIEQNKDKDNRELH